MRILRVGRLLVGLLMIIYLPMIVHAADSSQSAQLQISAPEFPVCSELLENDGDIASHKTGWHQIVNGGLLWGRDEVYRIDDERVVQCYCAEEGSGIQTNWWKTLETVEGWLVENGAQWNLGDYRYLAKNAEIVCTPEVSTTPTPTVIATPSATPAVEPTIVVTETPAPTPTSAPTLSTTPVPGPTPTPKPSNDVGSTEQRTSTGSDDRGGTGGSGAVLGATTEIPQELASAGTHPGYYVIWMGLALSGVGIITRKRLV